MKKLLNSKSNEFMQIVSACECTDAKGHSLEQDVALQRVKKDLITVREKKTTLYIIGNGGSAAVASHAVTDLVNACSIPATTLHDPALLTCMTNDYGYEQAFARILSNRVKTNDVLIAISSSGRSKNILNAVTQALKKNVRVITLSGFDEKNPLRSAGDLNMWLPSKSYGPVEMGHLFILHTISDQIKEEA